MSGAPSGAAITGLGITSLGRVFDTSPRRLAASAVRRAAADAGLALADLDGLLICPGISGGLDVGLAAALGLRDLSLLAVVNSFGASAVMAVQTAALAVTSGTARAVACVFADMPLQDGIPAGSAFGRSAGAPERHGLGGLASGYGFSSVTAYYALAARRHMARFGTTSPQFGAVAVAQRQWAAGNPLAQFRDPITLADHQESRWVAEPLHLLDCSLVTNGGIAVIVTSADAAAGGPKPPVHIWGWGQGHPGQDLAAGTDFGLVTGAAQAGRAAMAMAGVGPADITMAQIYDCYTFTVLVTLEDYGFCRKGEGGPFVASGALAPGGSLPVNTGGGQLSGYYMWGFTPLSEAVIQARGDGDRQAGANDLIVVSGNGGILAHHGTLVLSPHQRAAGLAGATGPGGTTAAPVPDRAGPGAVRSRPAATSPPAVADGMGVVKSDPRSAPFFAAAARGELLIKRCGDCSDWYPPTASLCSRCGTDAELSWAQTSGRGTLASWAVVHSRQGRPVAVPAYVELDEGPWLATGLMLAEPGSLAALRVGIPVAAEFVSRADGESYPVFGPLQPEPADPAAQPS